MTTTPKEMTMEDEEFLQDISELSERRRNGVIAYLENRVKQGYWEAV